MWSYTLVGVTALFYFFGRDDKGVFLRGELGVPVRDSSRMDIPEICVLFRKLEELCTDKDSGLIKKEEVKAALCALVEKLNTKGESLRSTTAAKPPVVRGPGPTRYKEARELAQQNRILLVDKKSDDRRK